MGKNRETYQESFKKQVAIEALESKKAVAEIASENGMILEMVSMWRKAFIEGDFSKELEEKRKALDAATMALGKAKLEIELLKKKVNPQGWAPMSWCPMEARLNTFAGILAFRYPANAVSWESPGAGITSGGSCGKPGKQCLNGNMMGGKKKNSHWLTRS